MKSQRNILIAFLLNLIFSLLEFAGGLFTGSSAILSDALHDLGDAAGIGVSWVMERKSRKAADGLYTFGYGRYSLLGSLITSGVLVAGSAVMLCHGVDRLLHLRAIHYDGMLLLSCLGLAVNICAAFVTHGGESLNQKAVNLHMLEDALGWVVVLVGALVMRFTDFALLDPLMSVGLSVLILLAALKNLRETGWVLLEKTPKGMNAQQLRESLEALKGIEEVHHLHLWSLDGIRHCATLHAVTTLTPADAKALLRDALLQRGITHVTLETEVPGEPCAEPHCHTDHAPTCCHHRH